MDKGKVADGAERESRRAAICFSSANVVNCSESCPSALWPPIRGLKGLSIGLMGDSAPSSESGDSAGGEQEEDNEREVEEGTLEPE